ncbi:DUF3310 domain-containing protein [Streptomyces decoyicus]
MSRYDTPSRFNPGTRVKVVGCKDLPALNGRVGITEEVKYSSRQSATSVLLDDGEFRMGAFFWDEELEEIKVKYMVGDKVRVLVDMPPHPAGEEGVVSEVRVPGRIYPYKVKLDGWECPMLEEELELVGGDSTGKKVASGVDQVVKPAHYTWLPNGVEVIDLAEHLNFNLGNVVKYVSRAGRKTADPLQDLQKAEFYIDREIQRVQKENEK